MANFNTHFNVACVASGIAASSLLTTGLFSPQASLMLWLAGTFGGMLPDIDADDSKAIRVIFTVFGGFAALLSVLCFYQQVSVVGLWLLAASAFIVVRYLLINIFELFTVHRGSLHSVLAVLLFGLIAVCGMSLLGKSSVLSWTVGVFVSAGATVHLLLDELYSVDLSNVRIKRSFGSALKIADFDRPFVSSLQIVLIAGLVYLAPPITSFLSSVENISSQHSHQFQFLPDWFTH